MKELEERIEKIEERNRRVEKDKAWETSFERRVAICILTYVVVIFYSYIIKSTSSIFFSSLVPVIGFTLSTLSLKVVRKLWEKRLKD